MIRCIFLVLILAGILTGGCGEQPAPVQNAGAKTIILYSELDNNLLKIWWMPLTRSRRISCS